MFQNRIADPHMAPSKKHNPLLELLVTIVAPSVILMKFSGEAETGMTPEQQRSIFNAARGA